MVVRKSFLGLELYLLLVVVLLFLLFLVVLLFLLFLVVLMFLLIELEQKRNLNLNLRQPEHLELLLVLELM